MPWVIDCLIFLLIATFSAFTFAPFNFITRSCLLVMTRMIFSFLIQKIITSRSIVIFLIDDSFHLMPEPFCLIYDICYWLKFYFLAIFRLFSLTAHDDYLESESIAHGSRQRFTTFAWAKYISSGHDFIDFICISLICWRFDSCQIEEIWAQYLPVYSASRALQRASRQELHLISLTFLDY